MKKRIISSISIWSGIILSIFCFGIHAAIILLAIIAYFSQLELYDMFEKSGLSPMKQFGLVCGSILILGSYYFGSIDAGDNIFLISFLLLILMIIRIDVKEGRLNSLMPTLFGFIYIPYFLHFYIKIAYLSTENGYGLETGIFLGIWVIVIASATDIGGYIFGKFLGKTKFSIISPKKTNEGAIGGIILAAIVGTLIVLLFNKIRPLELDLWKAFIITFPISFAAIASDLIESAFKRQAKLKDSSNMIPGLGGVFDMIDSLILTAPLAYLLIKFFVF